MLVTNQPFLIFSIISGHELSCCVTISMLFNVYVNNNYVLPIYANSSTANTDKTYLFICISTSDKREREREWEGIGLYWASQQHFFAHWDLSFRNICMLPWLEFIAFVFVLLMFCDSSHWLPWPTCRESRWAMNKEYLMGLVYTFIVTLSLRCINIYNKIVTEVVTFWC